MPPSVRDNLGWIATLLSIVGAMGVYVTHAQQDAVARDRDRQHIRTLERIVVSEFPQYSPAILWDDK